MEYTFGQIQQIALQSALVVHSVCAHETRVFQHSPGSVNGKQTHRLGLSLKQFKSILTEGKGVIWLTTELKYQ